MMLEIWKLTFIFIITLHGISGHAYETKGLQAECSNTSISSSTTIDDCSQCACITGNSYFGLIARADCVITEDVLERIMDQLFDAWRIITGTFSSRPREGFQNSIKTNESCNLGLRKTYSRKPSLYSVCDDLIFEIETMIQDITEQIQALIEWLDDPENFNPRLVLLEQCLKCVNKKLDDTIAQYEQDLGDIKERFGEMQQCLTDSINQRKEEIHQLEIQLEQKTYELLTSNVNASNYPSAFSAFLKLNNDTFINTLVDDIYGYSSNKVENLLTFAFILNKPEQSGQLYLKLLLVMQQYQHHQGMHILSVNKVIKDDVYRICDGLEPAYCTVLPPMYRDVLKLVDTFTKLLVYSLAQKICDEDYHSIYLTGSSESSVNLAGNAFTEVLPDILQRAFDVCPTKLNIISDFVRDLRWNKQKATGFTKLMSITSNKSDKLMVAFKMKQASENLRGPDGQEEEAKDVLIGLKDNLPGQIRSLAWQTSCTIKTPSNQYLHVSGTISPDNSRVILRSAPADASRWVYEPIERPDGEYRFRIRNENTGEYLGTHKPWKNENDDKGFAAARTEIDNEYPPRDFHWIVHFDSDPNRIKLLHVGRKAYLMVSGGNAALDLRALTDDSAQWINWINTCDS